MVGDSGPASERHDLRSLLKLHEGWRAYPYRDTVGKLTIGFGRNLDAKGISVSEGDYLLSSDMAEAEQELHGRWEWTKALDPVRHAVMVSMAFNMGGGVLAQFKTTLELVRTGDYTEASKQMLKSKWARQVGLDVGERAWTLSEMMRTGEWPAA